jgi:hypothetical protein
MRCNKNSRAPDAKTATLAQCLKIKDLEGAATNRN